MKDTIRDELSDDFESYIEIRAKAWWETRSSLRNEFSDDFESYLAYVKSGVKGLTKIDEIVQTMNSLLIEDKPKEAYSAEKTRKQWDENASIRVEFNGDFEAYDSYQRALAAGRVKIKSVNPL